ncbi:HAUS augmin-like complex subunit 6 [Pogona vitticeps]|uniref:HAUS augmin-like complex subunit 6 isoform X1 n=1 Tax=Pogona vitticeps TaxID=103695 RepID=A0A6J0TEQ0_9SAUR
MSATPPAWEKEHLWHYLLALGFDPAEAAAGKISAHLRLGVNMFEKPNKDAFHIVAWFLFSKLDQSRCNEIFRFCFPPADKKADSEFRKQCYEWLRKISDECGKNFPPIVASLFLSPGGPKFIHLMFHFARYVIMHHIKTDSAASGILYPEAMNSRSSDLNMSVAKYRVARNRFLLSLQKEDLIIQTLQRKAQIFSGRIRDSRYENADLDKQLQKMGKNVPPNQSNTTDRIEKVRCLWTSITEILRLLQNEREVVDSVVKGHVDQYILDSRNVAISVPRPLLERVEKEMHELSVGNIYEEGKLNILTVIQLLNKALEMLMVERQHTDKKALKLDLQYFEAKTKFHSETLLGLNSLRQKLKLEDHISISHSITEKQHEWDLKWKTCLGQSPFHLIKDPKPALNLLPAMSLLSFTPATEEAYKSSIFCQYPASISDLLKKNLQTNAFERAGRAPKSQEDSTVVTTKRIVLSANPAREAENKKHSEKGSNLSTPKRMEHSDFQLLKYKGRHSKLVETGKERQIDRLRMPSSVQREDALQKAQDQLAEEVADVVVSGSPQNTGGKDLEDLIGNLISNPFLTRKQIPRTPENLITEIRSSWKKAIRAEETSGAESHHIDATKDLPQEK